MVFRGHCYCGAVRFEVKDEASANIATYCHCESCRRAHAAPMYQVVYVPPEDIAFTQGEDKIVAFSKGGNCDRHFCSQCGSRVRNILNGGALTGFFPSLLDERIQHNLPDKFRPRRHYLSHESPMELRCLHDGLPRHNQAPAPAEGVKLATVGALVLCASLASSLLTRVLMK